MLQASDLIDRQSMIDDLATWYAVHPRFFRKLEQSELDRAWLCARTRWG